MTNNQPLQVTSRFVNASFLSSQKVLLVALATFIAGFSGLSTAHTFSPPKPHAHNFIAPIILLMSDDVGVVNDNLNATTGVVDTSLNVLSNDNLRPGATLVSFGGPAEVNVGDNTIGSSYTAASGAQITLAASGALTYDASSVVSASTGTETFFYSVDNSGKIENGEVTVNYGESPTAVDGPNIDSLFSDPLNIASGEGLLSNDNLGTPNATLVSFGGESLGGTINDNSPGTSVSIAEGELTVNADGSYSLVSPPLVAGTIAFSYRIQNDFGFDDALQEITITQPTTAVDDTLISKVNRNISFPASTLFADNGSGADNLGTPAAEDPEATITSFGNFNGVSGNAGEFAFGSTQSIPAPINGNLTVNADGSLIVDNPATSGAFTFQYTLDNGVGTPSVATVTVNVVPAPIAYADSYTFLATVDQSFNAGSGVFVDNGSGADFLGTPSSTLTSFGGGDLGGTVTSNLAGVDVVSAALGGTLTVNSDGSFGLTGQPFNEGTFTFDYRLTNNVGTSDATVTLVISNVPVARDDAFTFASTSDQTTPDTFYVDNGSGADTVAGGTITHFGGGSLGGAVTDNAGGASVALAGGTLTINTDGTWALTGQPFTGGVFTTNYRLTNASGSSDATITFSITAPPIAADDGPSMSSAPGNDFHGALNTTNSVANGEADDLDQNDNLGNPAGALDHFGAIRFNDGAGVLGSANGVVTDNAAGATLNFSTLGVSGITNGSLTVNANGSYILVPPTNYTGALRFEYRLTNASGSDTAAVTLAVGTRPQCSVDGYTNSVNIPISVADGSSDVLANDAGDLIVVSSVQGSAANVGNLIAGPTTGSSSSTNFVQLNANGSFSHFPAAGLAGANAFSYNVLNGFGASSPCTVTVTTSKVSGASPWFIDQSASGSSNYGTFAQPFTSIASFNTQNASGANQPTIDDLIYLDPTGSYNEADGINLLNGQVLIGGSVQFNTVYTAVAGGGAALSSAYTMFAGTAEGSRSTIASTAGDGIDLAQDNTVNGVNIGNTPSGFGVDGGVVGTPTISNMDISGSGGALRVLTSGNLSNVSLGQVSSSSSIQANIKLFGTSGTLTMASGGSGLAGSGASFPAVDVSSGSVGFTYSGDINKSNAGPLVLVKDNTGGTKTFSGSLTSTSGGNARGIKFEGNTGGATNFTGNVTVDTSTTSAIEVTNSAAHTVTFSGNTTDIDTTSGIGVNVSNGGTLAFNSAGTNTINSTTGKTFNASGGGVVTVTGSANLTSTSGRGVDIQSTSIGAGGVTFESVSVDGADIGINISITGAAGGFTVTGDGSTTASLRDRDGSGGTITNTTSHGVRINQASNISLNQMNISNAGDDGIFAGGLDASDSVNGFVMRGVDISNTGNAVGEHGIEFRDVTGAIVVENVRIFGGAEDAFRFFNNSGTIASFDVTSSIIDGNDIPGITGSGSGLIFELLASATMSGSATVNDTTVQNNFGSGLFFINNSTSGDMDVIIGNTTNNTLNANNNSINIAHGATIGDTSFEVVNNAITGTTSHGMNFFAAENSPSTGSFNGIIDDNVILGAANSISGGNGIRVNLNGNAPSMLAIRNNTIDMHGIPAGNVNGRGIEYSSRFGNKRTDVVISGNTVRLDDGQFPLSGIFVFAGSEDVGDNVAACIDLSGNTAVSEAGGSGGSGLLGINLVQDRFPSTAGPSQIILPGLNAGATIAQIEAFVLANNPGAAGDAGAVGAQREDANGFAGGPVCSMVP